MQSLAHYEQALKPVEQDSDSDAWGVSDSEEEEKEHAGGEEMMMRRQMMQSGMGAPRKRMSTGGSLGRSAIAEDLGQRLRATSLGSQDVPPPKPPRPVVEEESLPTKPLRPRVPLPTAPKPIWNGRLSIPPTPIFCICMLNFRLKPSVMKKPVEEDEDPFGDEHGIDAPKGNKQWLEL